MPEPDFAKLRLKFWGKCKVCKIAYADSGLFTQIHRLRFIDELTLTAIVAYLKDKFIEKNFSIILPNEVNLHTHFTKHIPVDLIVAYKTASIKKNDIVKVPKNDLSTDTKKALYKIVDERVAVYDDLEDLYKVFKPQVENFLKDFDGKINVVNSGQYAVLIKELKSFLVELAKMNSNEQLVKVILQTAFQKYTLGALQSIVKECEILKNSLRGYIKDTAEIDKMLSGHQSRLYDGLSSSSKDAISLVKDQFKIN